MVEYSIILTTLLRLPDHRKTVEECFNAVVEHTDWKQSELIVSDDASPLDVSFLRDAANTYIRRSHSGGCAVGWNQGLKLAKGNYLVVLSDDVTIVSGWLECMRKALDLFPKAMVSAPAVHGMPNQGGEPKEERRWFPGSCFMLRREALDKIGYFDEQFAPFNYEDVDYWTRVWQKGYTTARCFDVEVGHKEGAVIHNIDNNGEVDAANKERYFNKWGFNPLPVFYDGGLNFPWED